MLIALRSTGLSIAQSLVGIVGIVLIGNQSVHATVLEYDPNGKVTVTETQAQPKPSKVKMETAANSNVASLRELTRETAIRYSGAKGVRKAGLDALTFVEIFESLIERESAFDPKAVSPKGAQGLGQLIPETAELMGVSDPFDPRTNLIGSAKYFTLLLGQFGSLELALAAYNAGPERVKQYGGVPPFPETRAYIAWVLKDAGLKQQAEKPVKASIIKPLNTHVEKPLKGDISVWEF
ncbi:MAG: lytic transglycosylase domain-containing protein [bacterium]|nr:lytic transglycosylase domain-containing protein [bacterium]